MLLALELLLIGKFFPRCENLILRLDVRRIRPGRLGIGLRRRRSTTGKAAAVSQYLYAGGKTFEVALLFVGEVDR